ncbi:hypothetical protein V2J09_022181 [Rumex salicifolius]
MLTVDFTNAFNLVNRIAMLLEVRKRCPSISPWSTTRRPFRTIVIFAGVTSACDVTKIKEQCSLALYAWYLDDGTVVGDTSEIFWPSCHERKLSAGIFPAEISRPDRGVKLLGGVVNLDSEFVEGLAIKRAEKAVISLTPRVSCYSFVHIWVLPTRMDGEAIEIFNRGLREFIKNIVWRLSTLPIRYGELGLYSTSEASQYAFIASRVQPWVLQDHILRDSGVEGMDDSFNKVVADMQITLPDFDFSSFTNKNIVPPKAQNALMSALFFETGISAKKEAAVNFLTDPLEGRSTLRLVIIQILVKDNK